MGPKQLEDRAEVLKQSAVRKLGDRFGFRYIHKFHIFDMF